MFQNVIFALAATTVTWLFTLIGAGTTVFIKKTNKRFVNIILGFSAGIMFASSIWSLIIPALESANGFTVIIGFLAGAIVLYLAEMQITKFRNLSKIPTKTDKNLILMIISITIHNIPEGLAVGLAFGTVGKNNPDGLASAIALAIGIAIQNLPEGAAISLPLMGAGLSKRKSFLIGQASALVEPLFGVVGAVAVTVSKAIIPFCLSFAAGCMIFVVIEDLIPQANSEDKSVLPSFAFIFGFLIMMLLDVML